MSLLIALGLSLALTLLLELLFFLALGFRTREELLLVVLANLLTNPPVVLCAVLAGANTAWPAPAVRLPLEGLAILAEWACYALCGGPRFRRPLLLSLGANVFSYGAGLLLQLL